MLGSKTRLQIVAIVKNIKASVLWKTQFSHQPVYTSELLTEARYIIAMRKILTQVPANGKLFWLLYWLPAAKYRGCASLWNSVWQFNWTFCIITIENTYTHLKPQQLLYLCVFLLAFYQLFSVVLIVFVQPLISCASITTNLHSCFFASVISSLYKLPLFYQLTKKS